MEIQQREHAIQGRFIAALRLNSSVLLLILAVGDLFGSAPILSAATALSAKPFEIEKISPCASHFHMSIRASAHGEAVIPELGSPESIFGLRRDNTFPLVDSNFIRSKPQRRGRTPFESLYYVYWRRLGDGTLGSLATWLEQHPTFFKDMGISDVMLQPIHQNGIEWQLDEAADIKYYAHHGYWPANRNIHAKRRNAIERIRAVLEPQGLRLHVDAVMGQVGVRTQGHGGSPEIHYDNRTFNLDDESDPFFLRQYKDNMSSRFGHLIDDVDIHGDGYLRFADWVAGKTEGQVHRDSHWTDLIPWSREWILGKQPELARISIDGLVGWLNKDHPLAVGFDTDYISRLLGLVSGLRWDAAKHVPLEHIVRVAHKLGERLSHPINVIFEYPGWNLLAQYPVWHYLTHSLENSGVKPFFFNFPMRMWIQRYDSDPTYGLCDLAQDMLDWETVVPRRFRRLIAPIHTDWDFSKRFNTRFNELSAFMIQSYFSYANPMLYHDNHHSLRTRNTKGEKNQDERGHVEELQQGGDVAALNRALMDYLGNLRDREAYALSFPYVSNGNSRDYGLWEKRFPSNPFGEQARGVFLLINRDPKPQTHAFELIGGAKASGQANVVVTAGTAPTPPHATTVRKEGVDYLVITTYGQTSALIDVGYNTYGEPEQLRLRGSQKGYRVSDYEHAPY